MELGDLLIHKETHDEFGVPIFIWAVISQGEELLYIINVEKGLSKSKITNKFTEYHFYLPNHAMFNVLKQNEIVLHYKVPKEGEVKEHHNYVTQCIRSAKNLDGGYKAINAMYSMVYISYILRLPFSPAFQTINEKISKDKYLNRTKYPSAFNTLDVIADKFLFLKVITALKELFSENFPTDDSDFQNALIEQLTLGMFAQYYKQNRAHIRSATINYESSFNGDHRKFVQFKYLLNKLDEEIGFYQSIKEEDEKLKQTAITLNLNLPEEMNQKGILMKALEFDMSFWQEIIFTDLFKDFPVEKPYMKGISQSYNFMLLLPYFIWLAPNIFQERSADSYTDEGYSKMIIERMKSFIAGKISL